jgi:hypothetical protein
VDDEVFFLEDLLQEVQALREQWRQLRRTSSASTPAAQPDDEGQALLHRARAAEKAFAELEKQTPDGVLALGSDATLRHQFMEARGALVRLVLRGERSAELQLWKLHHRVADAYQRPIRAFASEHARKPAGTPVPAEMLAACAALEAFLRDAGALYAALIAAVEPSLAATLAAEAAATASASSAAAPPPKALRVLTRAQEVAPGCSEGGEGGEGGGACEASGQPAHHPLVASAAATRLSVAAAAGIAAACCVARGDLLRYASQLPLGPPAPRRDAAAAARRHYAAAARLRPAEGRAHHQIALLAAAQGGTPAGGKRPPWPPLL